MSIQIIPIIQYKYANTDHPIIQYKYNNSRDDRHRHPGLRDPHDRLLRHLHAHRLHLHRPHRPRLRHLLRLRYAIIYAAYSLIFIRHKSLDWTAITTFLLVLALAFQINTLYYFFWLEAFANTFTSTASFTSLAMISGVEASLTVIVTVFYFVSRLTHIQIFLITMLEVFAFALNWGICRWGINAITGGGGMTIWMFGLLYAIAIKKFYFLEAKNTENARYFTKTFQLIGIVIMIITWPSFNQLMAAHDTAVWNISASAILQQEAYLQTWLVLFSAVIASLGLRILG